jgi:hypothetical protein
VTIGTRFFWLMVAGLLLASAFFASRVEERRARGVEAAREQSQTGDAEVPP